MRLHMIQPVATLFLASSYLPPHPFYSSCAGFFTSLTFLLTHSAAAAVAFSLSLVYAEQASRVRALVIVLPSVCDTISSDIGFKYHIRSLSKLPNKTVNSLLLKFLFL